MMDFSVPDAGQEIGREGSTYGRIKERMQPFWYQGNLIDPNEELPFPLEQLEAENAWNDMWDAMTRRGAGRLYGKWSLEQNNNRRQERKRTFERSVLFCTHFEGREKMRRYRKPQSGL